MATASAPKLSTAKAVRAPDPLLAAFGDRGSVHIAPVADARESLMRDVREGLGARPYALPSKYFYDARGSALFDRICDTPEYYLTRAETSLLDRFATEYVAEVGASEIVELGSGAARKTRLLLDALTERSMRPRYVPVDVDAAILQESAASLLRTYPSLTIAGIVGDYRSHLSAVPRGGRRLLLFLGSSIGNYGSGEAEELLADVCASMESDDALLIGFDLVKDVSILEHAYNDAQGLTAAFNRNVLTVLDRRLDADFIPAWFDHVAFYAPEPAQIEMHLRATRDHEATIGAIGLRVPFVRGETIHTEISRKFTRETATATLADGGLDVVRWDESDRCEFALALARPIRHPAVL